VLLGIAALIQNADALVVAAGAVRTSDALQVLESAHLRKIYTQLDLIFLIESLMTMESPSCTICYQYAGVAHFYPHCLTIHYTDYSLCIHYMTIHSSDYSLTIH